MARNVARTNRRQVANPTIAPSIPVVSQIALKSLYFGEGDAESNI